MLILSLDGILDKHADCYHTMAGDYNFECNSTQQGYKLYNNLSSTYTLKCMDNKMDACGYTVEMAGLSSPPISQTLHLYPSTLPLPFHLPNCTA